MSKMIPNAVTVKILLELCEEQVKKGNGDKDVGISCDDEANGYHTLFYGFQDDKSQIQAANDIGILHDNNDPEDCVLLG